MKSYFSIINVKAIFHFHICVQILCIYIYDSLVKGRSACRQNLAHCVNKHVLFLSSLYCDSSLLMLVFKVIVLAFSELWFSLLG